MLLAAALCLFAAALAAPQPAKASIRGFVRDEQGAVVPGVTVTAVGGGGDSHSAVTDETGFFRLVDLEPGAYRLLARIAGFTPFTRVGLVLRPGVNLGVGIDLGIAGISEHVEVFAGGAAEPEVTSFVESPNIGLMISRATLDALPVIGHDYLATLRLLPGVTQTTSGVAISGAQDTQKNYNIDNVDNIDLAAGRALPGGGYSLPDNKAYVGIEQEAIQRLSVATAGYGADQGFGSGGLINIITKSGTNVFKGSVRLAARNDRWDYHRSVPYRDYRFSGGAGGPIKRDTLFVFGDAGFGWNGSGFDTRAYLYRRVPSDTEDVKKELSGFGKLTWRASSGQTFNFSVNAPHSALKRWIVLFRDPKDFVRQTRTSDGAVLTATHTMMLGARTLLESSVSGGHTRVASSSSPFAHAGFIWRYPSGESTGTYGDDWMTKDKFFWSQKLTYQAETLGVHNLTSGFDLRWNRSDDWRAPTEEVYYYDYPDYPIRYESTITPDYRLTLSQTYLAAFVADQWRPHRKVTVNLGLRASRDSYLRDIVVEPRFGVALQPAGTNSTVLRAGANLYSDRINMYAQQLANYPLGLSVTARADGTTTVGAREGYRAYVLDPTLTNPKTTEFNAGVEQPLPGGFLATATFVHRKYDDELFTRYTNLLDAATRGRADGSKGALAVMSNAGWASYRGILLSVRKTTPGRYQFLASFSREVSRGNCFLFADFSSLQPIFDRNLLEVGDVQPADLSGKTMFDKPYDVKVFGSVRLPLGFSVSGVGVVTAGTAYTAFDSYERVMVGGYQSRRSEPTVSLDFRLQKDFAVRGGVASFMLEAFNVTNHTNVLEVDGDITRATFGQPYTLGPARQLQAAVRVRW